jgi:hypothetical protein
MNERRALRQASRLTPRSGEPPRELAEKSVIAQVKARGVDTLVGLRY